MKKFKSLKSLGNFLKNMVANKRGNPVSFDVRKSSQDKVYELRWIFALRARINTCDTNLAMNLCNQVS